LSDALLTQFGVGTLVALLIWFVFAPQCISTFAVMKRETNSYKWPVIMVLYTMTLAYVFAFLARQIVLILS
jgi:ferrous iron transport protein B